MKNIVKLRITEPQGAIGFPKNEDLSEIFWEEETPQSKRLNFMIIKFGVSKACVDEKKGMIKMAKMNVRKMKMRCDVKGCRNVDSYCISRSAEMGGVVICEDCLRDALTAIENYVEPKKKTDTKPPELFYSGIEDIVSEVSDNDDELSLAGEAAENDTSQKDVPNTEDIQNTETEDVPNLSKKPTNSKSATPKRAAKKKTAERGNDK